MMLVVHLPCARLLSQLLINYPSGWQYSRNRRRELGHIPRHAGVQLVASKTVSILLLHQVGNSLESTTLQCEAQRVVHVGAERSS